MSGKPRVVAILPVLDEGDKIQDLVARVPRDVVDEVLVVDDHSVNETAERARRGGAAVITNAAREGCGGSIRIGIDHALRAGAEIIVVMAGNGKDDPRYIPSLVEPILQGRCDFVQGSRYAAGGTFRNMPLHRRLGTRAYSLLFSTLNGRWITDATNGFRAFRAELVRDERVNIRQDWLINYEVESYLFAKTIRLGYRVGEVPVSKIYPASAVNGYTKMKPVVDWWRHFRPTLLLACRIKR